MRPRLGKITDREARRYKVECLGRPIRIESREKYYSSSLFTMILSPSLDPRRNYFHAVSKRNSYFVFILLYKFSQA